MKMYITKNRYQCSEAREFRCPMQASVDCKFAHEQISRAICDRLLAMDGYLDVLVTTIGDQWQDNGPLRAELEKHRRQQERLQPSCDRLTNKIADEDDAPHSLVNALKEKEHALIIVQGKIDETVYKLAKDRPVPSRSEIEGYIREVCSKILAMDREAGAILRQIIDGRIWAVPYQVFRSRKVVLRADFRLRIANILPTELHECLSNNPDACSITEVDHFDFVVDLFKPSLVQQHALSIWREWQEPGITRNEICSKYGISFGAAFQAKRLGKAMTEAGITDPFVRLTEPPPNASRWRYKRGKKRKDAA